MENREVVVNKVREFNRFYTVLQGFLNRNYLDSEYSVTETRVLFELQQRGQVTAGELIETLRLDKGYISRLVRSLEQRGLMERHVSPQDGRALVIRLTPTGEQETGRLIHITNCRIQELIAPLSWEDCTALCRAMETIMDIFQ